MVDLIETTQQRSDAQLIAAVRAGDTAAYGLLFQRHVAAATRLSRQLLSTGEADDLVSEAFLKVLSLLQDGKGPDEAFRAYLLTAVRRLHVDRIRATTRTRPTDDEHVLDRGVPFDDAVSAAFENDAAARAFASLPERWQLVLWHLEVEGQKPAAVAPLLGMSPNSVSALAYRAREGLRAAYLESHAAATTDEACRAVTPLLGGFVRQTLSARDTAKVDQHLDACRRCTGVHLELVEVNQNLRGLLAPALLGPAAAGYLGATGTAAAALGAGGI
ncbi:sigma-70 family RNA polymerase sigma factor, partial [Aeromicrobium sp. 50.2.37]|uniref:sigma-70 family RNA polymerase sigma factor n=1 Tax=Aeromicrobium sp. 50.2.37 TaxID=2969305 RepID=UPI00214F6DCE